MITLGDLRKEQLPGPEGRALDYLGAAIKTLSFTPEAGRTPAQAQKSVLAEHLGARLLKSNPDGDNTAVLVGIQDLHRALQSRKWVLEPLFSRTSRFDLLDWQARLDKILSQSQNVLFTVPFPSRTHGIDYSGKFAVAFENEVLGGSRVAISMIEVWHPGSKRFPFSPTFLSQFDLPASKISHHVHEHGVHEVELSYPQIDTADCAPLLANVAATVRGSPPGKRTGSAARTNFFEAALEQCARDLKIPIVKSSYRDFESA